MLPSPALTTLAEVIADGATPDWDVAESTASSDEERSLIRQLRDATAVGRLRALQVTGGFTLGGSLPSARLQPGETWGPLRIVAHVGHGRFGDVYRAHDPTLDRHVALKLLRGPLDPGSPDATSVVEEGRLMARVRHPNVITIHGAQTIDGRTGLWMEFIEGHTLATEVRERGPLEALDVARIGVALCEALSAVHRAGLVHRDVKAPNVLRDSGGRIVLGDFGTGRELAGDALDEPLVGTPVYLAPEIFAGSKATAASDIYSLGVLLYYLGSGAFPVPGSSVRAIRRAHDEGQRDSLRAKRPDWPAPLIAAIDRALEADPARRFADARDMAGALGTVLNPGRRRRLASAAAAAMIVALAGGGAWYRSASAVAPLPVEAREWVLIADFENHSGDPALDDLPERTLRTTLAASGIVNVVPRQRIEERLARMRRPASTILQADVAREIAVRDGEVRLVLAGDVRKAAEEYVLTASLVRPDDGVTVSTVDERARTSSDVQPAIERLSKQILHAVREPRGQVAPRPVSLPPYTTMSLRALELLAEAKDIFNNDGPNAPPGAERRVEALLRQAIEEDPSFAMAHIMLADALRYQRRPDEARVHIARAREANAGTSDYESLAIIGKAYKLEGRFESDPLRKRLLFERAASSFEALTRVAREDENPLVGLTRTYQAMGQLNDAYAAQSRIADIRRDRPLDQSRAADLALATGDLVAARAFMTRARAALAHPRWTEAMHGSIRLRLRIFDALEAWCSNDPGRVVEIGDEIHGEMASMAPGRGRQLYAIHLHLLFMSVGQLRKAEALIPQMAPDSQTGFLGRVISQYGDQERLAVFMRERMRQPDVGARNTYQNTRIVSLWIEAGMLETARRALHQLAEPGLVQGQLALAESRIEEAIALLRRAQEPTTEVVFNGAGNTLFDGEIPRNLAIALTLAGRPDHAIDVLESASNVRSRAVSVTHAGYEWLRVRDDLAQLYRQVGRIQDAEAIEADLRATLALADDDHMIKRRLAALPAAQ